MNITDEEAEVLKAFREYRIAITPKQEGDTLELFKLKDHLNYYYDYVTRLFEKYNIDSREYDLSINQKEFVKKIGK